MRFSIAIKGADVSKDIGCCDTFLIFEEKQGKIIMRQNIESPGQQPDLLPGFLEKFKIEAIICGAMDTPVRLAFNDKGISVITGVSGNAGKIAEGFVLAATCCGNCGNA